MTQVQMLGTELQTDARTDAEGSRRALIADIQSTPFRKRPIEDVPKLKAIDEFA